MAKEGKEITPRKEELQRMPQRMMTPFDEMERMFEGFFPSGWMRPFRTPSLWGEMGAGAAPKVPAVDIIDREEELVVRAELPGMKKEDIDVSMSDNSVTISGQTKHEAKEAAEQYYRCEISRGAFSRTVTLPAEVDSDKTKASFKDGVLELVMPKQERSRRHTIKVE